MKARALLGALAMAALASACGDDDGAGPAEDGGVDAELDDAGAPLRDAARDTGSSGPPAGPVDRAGRFLVVRALVRSDRRDSYNQAASFADPTSAPWRTEVGLALEALDALDGTEDWAGAPHPLRETMLGDYLLLDTSKSCAGTPGPIVDCPSYLDLETAAPGANATFGGRTPNDDAFDATLTLLVSGRAAYLAGCSNNRASCVVRDGVGPAAQRRATDAFPYLVP